jgi:hypothetical protein
MAHHTDSRLSLSIAAACAAFIALSALPAMSAEVEERRTASSLSWTAPFAYQEATIAVSGPAGVISWTVPAGEPLLIETAALTAWAMLRSVPVDGAYSYELRFSPKLDAASRAALERQRTEAGGAEAATAGVAALPVVSGHFQLADGAVVGVEAGASEEGAAKDQVIPDDLIVDGSLCVGFDCINLESFGFDTIRLKENNLRIKFLDTSSASSFPTNDWQIIANDSLDGGASYLGFEDVDAGRKPFMVMAGSRANALFVSSSGRIGFGTSVPFVDLHMVRGDTPTVRLDQDGSFGWAPQIWDLAGNETNFFIRDVTHGSKLPLRIQSGAPTSTLTLRADGKVGIGTWSPAAPLEIETTGADATLLLDRTDGGQWYLTAVADGSFTLGASAEAGEELLIVDEAGNLTTSGTVNGISDRAAKRDFAPVDGTRVLDAVAGLPITEWSLVSDAGAARHLGPTAQDFRAAFGLGGDERHIALSDLSGVALAAIQALLGELEQRDREIEELSRRLQELESTVGSLQ